MKSNLFIQSWTFLRTRPRKIHQGQEIRKNLNLRILKTALNLNKLIQLLAIFALKCFKRNPELVHNLPIRNKTRYIDDMKATTNKAYIDILNQEYLKKVSQNPKYTLRAFANDLQLSPSTLSELLGSKKSLSQKTGLKVALALKLSRLDREIFLTSLLASKPGTSKISSEKKLQQLLKKREAFRLNEEELQHADSWHHFAILELVSLQKSTYEVLAEKLDLPLPLVQKSLAQMTQMGWVKKINKEYICTFDSSHTSDDVPSSTIRKYHLSVLSKSQEILHKTPVEEREFQSVTLTCNKDDMAEAKEMIRSFVDKFCDKFGNTNDKNSVSHLAVQFYGVSK